MNLLEHAPDIDDYYPLYIATGWNEIQKLSRQDVEKAIQQSYACVCIYDQATLVGFGRVVSDGIVYAAIYDVIVKDEYKRQGIGTEIVKRLVAKCKQDNIRSIHLFAAKGVATFYSKLDFIARPDDEPGMKYAPDSR